MFVCLLDNSKSYQQILVEIFGGELCSEAHKAVWLGRASAVHKILSQPFQRVFFSGLA